MGHPFKHLGTVTRHRHLVFRLCVRCGIPLRGLLHDLSKYSLTEFVPGAKYYTGHSSPTGEERKARGYSRAWLHHKGHNRHHFEYWTYYTAFTAEYVRVRMPVKYVKEMFCDRVSAAMVYHGVNYTTSTPLDFFLERRDREGMHAETADLLESWFRLYAERGNAAFATIKATRNYPSDMSEGTGSKSSEKPHYLAKPHS